jgi:ATP synthase protein I
VLLTGPDDKGSPGAGDRSRSDGLSSYARSYQKAEPYIGASFSLVASVGAFSMAGYWLDGKVGNQKPWFFIVGAVLGMVGGFISFFRTVLGMAKAGKVKEPRA